jgi:hypothetical protein
MKLFGYPIIETDQFPEYEVHVGKYVDMQIKNLDNRIKQIWVTPELLHMWIVEGTTFPHDTVHCDIGIPDDGIFLRGGYDSLKKVFIFIYAHPDWPELLEGQEIPIINCQFTKVDYGNV